MSRSDEPSFEIKVECKHTDRTKRIVVNEAGFALPVSDLMPHFIRENGLVEKPGRTFEVLWHRRDGATITLTEQHLAVSLPQLEFDPEEDKLELVVLEEWHEGVKPPPKAGKDIVTAPAPPPGCLASRGSQLAAVAVLALLVALVLARVLGLWGGGEPEIVPEPAYGAGGAVSEPAAGGGAVVPAGPTPAPMEATPARGGQPSSGGGGTTSSQPTPRPAGGGTASSDPVQQGGALPDAPDSGDEAGASAGEAGDGDAPEAATPTPGVELEIPGGLSGPTGRFEIPGVGSIEMEGGTIKVGSGLPGSVPEGTEPSAPGSLTVQLLNGGSVARSNTCAGGDCKPEWAFDGRADTAWCFPLADMGSAALRLGAVGGGDFQVTRIVVTNGYAKSEQHFQYNHRPKRLGLGATAVTLADSSAAQSVTAAATSSNGALTLTILGGTYPSSAAGADDVCITELAFEGTPL